MLCRIAVVEPRLTAAPLPWGPVLLWVDDHFIMTIGALVKMEAIASSRPYLSLVPSKFVRKAGMSHTFEMTQLADQLLIKEYPMRRMQWVLLFLNEHIKISPLLHFRSFAGLALDASFWRPMVKVDQVMRHM